MGPGCFFFFFLRAPGPALWCWCVRDGLFQRGNGSGPVFIIFLGRAGGIGRFVACAALVSFLFLCLRNIGNVVVTRGVKLAFFINSPMAHVHEI
jgi:hypothetical protein